jgi:hypothetical protein
MKFNIELKAGDDKGNLTKFDHTILKVNFNRCNMREGGTFFHRVFYDIFQGIQGGKIECPIKKGNHSIYSEITDTYFPPTPRVIFPSGVVRVVLKIFQRGKPFAKDKKLSHIALYEVVAIYEK